MQWLHIQGEKKALQDCRSILSFSLTGMQWCLQPHVQCVSLAGTDYGIGNVGLNLGVGGWHNLSFRGWSSGLLQFWLCCHLQLPPCEKAGGGSCTGAPPSGLSGLTPLPTACLSLALPTRLSQQQPRDQLKIQEAAMGEPARSGGAGSPGGVDMSEGL